MKKLFIPIAVFTALLISSCGSSDNGSDTSSNEGNTEAKEEICFYHYSEGSAAVRWTAFKTNDKVGVGGQFDVVNVTAGEKSTKITEVLETIKFNISTSSTNTANADRDKKIVEHFFNTMESTDIILGQVKSATGDNNSGTCVFYLTLNNVEKEVTLDYTVKDDVITLTGEIDMTDFGAESAVEAINKACEALHTGADGVSKTWPNVELAIEAKLTKECH